MSANKTSWLTWQTWQTRKNQPFFIRAATAKAEIAENSLVGH
jgi:hypothetical protein